MTTAFDKAHSVVVRLAEEFHKNRVHYLGPRYQESEARLDFIDKFWIALGWDVNHDVQRNPYEQEVKVERGVNVGAARKRADYAFFAAPNFREGDVKFFVEAKRPSADLATPDNCFQLARYAWSGHIPISVLFSFNEIVILDCRAKPDIETSHQRVLKRYHVSDFGKSDLFAEIYWLFSREALAQGSIDKFAKTLPTKRGAVQRGLFKGGYQGIDDVFLQELDGYRDALARNFKNNNPALDGDALTELTQRTLDRLVFMRFLEDKLIEPEPLVSKFGVKSGRVWDDFIAASRRLDGIYNGIVFKKSALLDSPAFKVHDDQFAAICEELSDINSPYDFNAIPIHILGSIYENFLGKVIVATEKRAHVELKPEVRKAGGVYYTPEEIVHFMVENTVGLAIEGKTPAQIAEMKIADIACGSGSFLLGVFDYLLRFHTRYYAENPKRAKKGDLSLRDDGIHLSLAKKREILVNNIFGADIDSQAVEVAQLSLYLKLLQDETQGTIRGYQLEIGETLLPSMTKNIVCGNSIVGMDVLEGLLFEPVEERKLNPMEWNQRFPSIMRNGGFDVILGNPPYVDSEWMTQTAPVERAYCSNRYKAASGNWDLFCVFIERAATLLKPSGLTSLIVPNKLASAGYARKAREVLTADNTLLALRDYSHVKVFPVAVYPIIYIAKKATARPRSTVLLETMSVDGGEVKVSEGAKLPYAKYFADAAAPWQIFANSSNVDFIQALVKKFPPLADPTIADVTGAATVSEAYLLQHSVKESGTGFKLINSGSIDRFCPLWGVKECRYLGASYLHPTISRTELHKVAAARSVQASAVKIIVAGMTLRLECVLDSTGEYIAGKSTSVVLPKVDPFFLLGILNSKLVNFFYESMFGGNKLAGGYLRVGPPQLGQIPVPANASPKEVKQLAGVVKKLMEAQVQLVASRSDKDIEYLRNKCEVLDQQIDVLVFELYGLSDADRRVVLKIA